MHTRHCCSLLPAALPATLIVTASCLAVGVSRLRAEELTWREASQANREVEILRDRFGVPHIYAQTLADANFGLGYCQAEDNLREILRYYVLARAEGAKAFGRESVANDFQLRMLKIPGINRRLYENMEPEARQIVDAYAEGINRYLADHPAEKPEWFDQATGLDIVAIAKAFQLTQTIAVVRDDLKRAAKPKPNRHGSSEGPEGSNMWAVGPKRSARGETMLLSDPHVPWKGRMQWHESHLIVGDRWLYGATFFGGPAAGIGFTQDVAWGSTNNGADIADVYRERINPDNGNQYFYNGQWRAITTERIELDVRQPDGSLARTHRVVRRTHHGPIIQEDRDRHVAYAARLAGLATVNLAAMCPLYFHARRIADLEKLFDTGHLYKWHRIACDRHGEIGYWYMSATHERSDQFDWRAPVDGTIKETEWGPPIPWRNLPHTINPPSGLLVNCNNSPYTVTPERSLRPEDFPRHLAGRSSSLPANSRAYRAFELLNAEPAIDFADMERIATDVKVLTADQYLRILLQAHDRAGAEFPDEDGRLARAIAILKQWDGLATTENRALPILATVLEITRRDGDNGRFRQVQPQRALQLLSKALDLLEERWGSWEVPWGRVHVIRRGEIELPIGGAGNSSAADPFTTLLMAGAKQVTDGKYVTGSGTSWIQLVKYHNDTVEAKTILPYGNSNRPDSPHYADQMPIFARGQLKHALITREQVEAATRRRLKLVRR